MVGISFDQRSNKSTHMFVWNRVYWEGRKWTPVIIASIRYPLNKGEVNEH
jgi:hypothetical protein